VSAGVLSDPAGSRPPRVTVVVIVFNDRDRVHIAIESAMAQNLRDIEIVVVDHGSTDGSAAAAERFAAVDPRVRVVRLPDNDGGPGRPLNAGIDAARAPYVTVMGSDDELDRDACRALLAAAEVEGADVVMGRTDRIHVDEGGWAGSWFHAIYKRGRAAYDSIHDRPGLMWDTISAAKLYRKAFLDEHGLRLPEDVIYEDQLFTAAVYLHARRIAVIPNTVYRWTVLTTSKRHRPSLTNTRDDLQNLADRLEVNRRIDELYEAHQEHELALAKHEKFFSHDIKLYLRDLGQHEAAFREPFLRDVSSYVESIPIETLLELKQPLRALSFALRCGDLEAALDAFEILRNSRKIVTSARRDDRGRVVLAPWLLDRHERAAELLGLTELGLDFGPMDRWILDARLRSVSRDGEHLLRLEGVLSNPFDAFPADVVPDLRLVLRRRHRRGQKVAFPVTALHPFDPHELAWTATVDVRRLPRVLARHLTWEFRLEVVTTAGRPPANAALSVEERLIAPDIALRARTRLRLVTGDALVPRVSRAGNLSLRLHNRSQVGSRLGTGVASVLSRLSWLRRTLTRLREQLRSRLSRAAFVWGTWSPRLDDLVVFESFEGRQYSDNPRVISEALSRARPDLRRVWGYSAARGSDRFPDDVELVPRDSPRYYYLLGRAAYWVENFGLPAWIEKPARTTYLQTWHGTPIKLMFLEAPKVREMPLERREGYERSVNRWDYLISPGEYFERTFARSANYQGRILRTGTPRVDVMLRAAAQPREEVLRDLGVPADRRIVLYAPTYRPGSGARPLDLEALSEELKQDHFILVRQHYFRRAQPIPTWLGDFAADVSELDDVAPLLGVADVLISDYSSIVFDFSVLRRPVVLYTPDLERYEASVGTYIDLRRDAPGPLAVDTDELIAALREVQRDPGSASDQADAFRARFADHEDGHATARIVATVWGTDRGVEPFPEELVEKVDGINDDAAPAADLEEIDTVEEEPEHEPDEVDSVT
jgi:CDP-glycerol glycerophosphotransferase